MRESRRQERPPGVSLGSWADRSGANPNGEGEAAVRLDGEFKLSMFAGGLTRQLQREGQMPVGVW